ncbi:hypothetical protein [Microvirga alba]|uniref:Uncharacterized protein n=1 Tax=Microvirga alba TaxID=2791025 RepID=A0A931BRN7_9HYPH|nr:hypothetical protein [Microvirga alba]MBF9234444.1 hypothetical protein [Microvirga alba]
MMAFWWVNHSQTYRQEIEGRYIWSPKTKGNGGPNRSYDNLRLLVPGDLVFSYAGGQIRQLGIITHRAVSSPKPPELGSAGTHLAQDGWMVPVEWYALPQPLRPKEFISEIRPHLPKKYAPLNEEGNGYQHVYLAAVPDGMAEVLLARLSALPQEVNAESRVAEAYRQLGYNVHQEVLFGPLRVDLVIERRGQRTPVEVLSSGKPLQADRLQREIVRLSTLRGADLWSGTPIIIVASDMTPETQHWSQHQTEVSIRTLADLEAEVGALAQRAPTASVREEAPAEIEARRAAERRDTRAALIKELKDHESGAVALSPTEFERLCMRTFIFLFDPNLFGFERQAETSDGGNRYDFICRIAPGRPFWDSLRADFRTKALLFECKNYQDPITADQIYSTERYLFAGALRTVCFLIAPKGGDAGCLRAAQGAMRESGKLILVLSNLDLVELLEIGEDSDSAENFLDERIWRFIISLPR